jgi:uncharacterized protein YndB with AHSA1/START domain
VITVAMSTAVSADRKRVWRALAVPAELMSWDEQLIALLDPADCYPREGQHVRWRYRLGTIAVVLRNSLLEVVPGERLRSASATSLFRFDETFSLGCEAGEPERTRLQLKLVAANSVPMVGGLLDRFAVRRLATALVDRKLRSIQKWCENHP